VSNNSTAQPRRLAIIGHGLAGSILHAPFHVISLGTSQSLGWVLLLPSLALSHLAYRDFSRTRALGAGLLLGVLFYSHTLTFVNVAAAQLAYLVVANALERLRDAKPTRVLTVNGMRTVAMCPGAMSSFAGKRVENGGSMLDVISSVEAVWLKR